MRSVKSMKSMKSVRILEKSLCRLCGVLGRRLRGSRHSQGGYVLINAMLVLVAAGMLAATLTTTLSLNHEHVSRDRAYTDSLAIAEAGLNQYLWMVQSGASSLANNYAIPGATGDVHYKQFQYLDPYNSALQGTYAIRVTGPSVSDSNITVKVTGKTNDPLSTPRTISAHVSQPSFSQYLLLTNDEVWIGGPLDRVWHGKTFSNTGICIDTANVNDIISCARQTYSSSMFGGTRNGVWSGHDYTVPSNDPSRAYWQFPVPPIDFQTVTADFPALNTLAVGNGVNLPYSTTTAHDATQGWYIKLLPSKQYQIWRVTGETESATYNSGGSVGGNLTLVTPTSPVPSGVLNYPANGIIYVNDNVWVEGTNLSGRVTIASSGQLNAAGKTAATSAKIVGDLTYSVKDGTVAVGVIAQNNVEIPAYAPWKKSGTISSMDMEVDGALIAEAGKEWCNAADLGGPDRDTLTIYGSVSSYTRPYRYNTGNDGGFQNGSNTYDPYLLHNPPPYFPTAGTYQIIDWTELSSSQGLFS
jgi:hypothetical protein